MRFSLLLIWLLTITIPFVAWPANADEKPAILVTALPLTTETVVARFITHGTVEPNPRQVYFLESGFLKTLHLSEGDAVKKGDVLAQLDDQLILTSVVLQRVRLRQSEADLERSITLASKGVVPKKALDDARDTRDKVRQELAEALVHQKRHTLRSPVNGVIVRRYIEKPQTISSETAIYAVRSNDDDWYVEVDVPQRDVSALRPDDEVLILISAFGDTTLNGRIDSIAGVASEPDGFYQVRLSIIDDAPRLRAGMRATALLPRPQDTRTGPMVPVNALHDIIGKRATIYLAKELPGIADRVSVQIALINGDHAVLADTLDGYKWVLTGGTYRVQAGDIVTTGTQ